MQEKEDTLLPQSGLDISKKLQSYMQILQFFDENIDGYIYVCDLKEDRIYFTDKIREKFPLPPADENGNSLQDWRDIIYAKDREYLDYYKSSLREGKINSFDILYRVLDRENEKIWVNATGKIREGEPSQPGLLVGHVSEITSHKVVDELTGLCGNGKLMEDLKQYLSMTSGYLMVLGVDDFRKINATHGRNFGNGMLKKMAGLLEKYAEYPVHPYRLDGDCFAVVFPGKQQQDVTEFYRSMQKELQQLCTISAGVVSFKAADPDINRDLVYQYAENALDRAKREGKDQMVFFSEDYYQQNLEQIALLDELRISVLNDFKGFELLYQPQVSSSNFSLYGAEALLRYHSESRGQVSPVEFIPLLEKSGLICPVGEWVLNKALQQCREWRKYLPDFRMSVNISHVQLQQKKISENVLQCVKKAQLSGDALTLEITESLQLQDYSYFNAMFYEWKQFGIQIAIDDFGTGYSSLSYLKSIEIDEVKIDRCFVDRVQYNAYNYRLLSNMIELAHSAKISVCCEGVETVGELQAIQQLHADLQQGYLFAKPCTKEMFEKSYFRKDAKEYQTRLEREAHFSKSAGSESEVLLKNLRNEEIGNIVESMDEVVSVSDPDSYELYYLNAAGREMTGVYDYKGRKCYQVLQGRTQPCKFCNNARLNEKTFFVWERENAFLKRHYILKDKLIPWQGKIARLEMAFDITDRKKAEEKSCKR